LKNVSRPNELNGGARGGRERERLVSECGNTQRMTAEERTIKTSKYNKK